MLGAQKNRLVDTILLNAHNICFQHGISHMTLHIIPSHFSRTGRHEATRPFIFHIAPMEFHILDTSVVMGGTMGSVVMGGTMGSFFLSLKRT